MLKDINNIVTTIKLRVLGSQRHGFNVASEYTGSEESLHSGNNSVAILFHDDNGDFSQKQEI